MTHQKLINARKNKNLSQLQMAEKVAMEQTTYSRKERGKSPITENEWERFAEALNIPVEDIRDEIKTNFKNVNCTFNDHTVGIQYINIPQDVLEIIIKYNQKLESEIHDLKAKLSKDK